MLDVLEPLLASEPDGTDEPDEGGDGGSQNDVGLIGAVKGTPACGLARSGTVCHNRLISTSCCSASCPAK